MIQSGDVVERHAIPRWNNIDTASELGELAPIKQQRQNSQLFSDVNEHLESLLCDWHIEPSLPLAIEIVSIARFSNDTIDIGSVKDYAMRAIKHMDTVPPLLLDALDLDSPPPPIFPSDTTNSLKSVYASIATLKRSLSQFPRNPLNWCELARQYLIVGQLEKSEKALQVARSLAPNHRVVLRALAHFYAHINDFDQGLYYLRNSSIVTYDPWVLSSEIALSNEIQRTSKLIKHGLLALENTNINPNSLSELASELGTMDFMSGNKKKGRKKLEIAKRVPHENSVAQMAWINQKLCNIEPIIHNINEPKYNYEAEAKWCVAQENWTMALNTICKWQGYQPFSKAPAMEGSYIAADYLNDPQKAISILNQGRLSNPNDPELLNNYIYSHIMAGNLNEAANLLIHNTPPSIVTDEHLTLIATHGLFHYRNGSPDIGKTFYQVAIDNALRLNQLETAYRARIYFAREEKRIGADISSQLEILNSEKNKPLYLANRSLIETFNLV